MSRYATRPVNSWVSLSGAKISRARRWQLRNRERYLNYLRKYHAENRDLWKKGGRYFNAHRKKGTGEDARAQLHEEEGSSQRPPPGAEDAASARSPKKRGAALGEAKAEVDA